MVMAASAHKMTLGRNKMNISKKKLRQIVIEEYMREEGLQVEAMTQEKADEFVAWIKKEGPKPEWLDREYGPGSYRRGKQAPANDPHVDRSAETRAFSPDDMPQYNDEYDEEGAYDTEAEAPTEDSLVDQIAMLVKGMDAEDVSDLFQAVFMKIPGVEIGPPEEDDSETLYAPGAEGRPTIGFNEIKQLIRKVLTEGHYHDMGGDDEMYSALDPYGFDEMSDSELIDMVHADGMEEMIVLDGEGNLINREEILAVLKDV